MAIAALDIPKGSVVADVGCGPGYMTQRLAKQVGRMAWSTVRTFSRRCSTAAEKYAPAGIEECECVLGTETDPKLPKGAIDLILLVDVYHEFSHPREMLAACGKPCGRVDGWCSWSTGRKIRMSDRELHKMTVPMARAEIVPEGFRFDKSIEVLPWQHIIIFRKPPD